MDNTLIYVFITNSLVQLICYRFFFDTDTSEMWTLNSSPLVSISRKFNRIKYLESSVKSLVQNPERSELFVLNFASLASAASFWVSFQEAKDDFVSFITGSRGVGERWGSRSGKSCRAHFRLEDQWNIALCSSRVMLGALWKLPTPVPPLDCRVTWVHDLGAVGQAKRSLIGPYYDLLPNMHHPQHHPYIFVAEAICTLLIKNQRDHSNSAER